MNAIVIVAGGKGLRMGGDLPKQFMKIRNENILTHTVNRFIEYLPSARIYLVVAKFYLHHPFLDNLRGKVTLVEGGDTRFESVKNGLIAAKDSNLIWVHDAVRPFFSERMIEELMENAQINGGAIPVMPVIDSLRFDAQDGNSFVATNRELYRAVQTPQVFKTASLLAAFSQPYDESFTDEATVWEKMGHKIALVPGESYNIKITTPMDLVYAQGIFKYLEDQKKT